MAEQLKEPVMFAGSPLTASILRKCLPSIAAALNREDQLVPQSIFRSMLTQELANAQSRIEAEFAEIVTSFKGGNDAEEGPGDGEDGLASTAVLHRALHQARVNCLDQFYAEQRSVGQPENMIEGASAELGKRLEARLVDALCTNERGVQVRSFAAPAAII
jgi:hypothetical protein